MSYELQVNTLKRLIKVAHSMPETRNELWPKIQLLLNATGLGKTAVSEETQEFESWVTTTQSEMSPSEVLSFLTRQLHMELQAPRVKAPGARFEEGDLVNIRADKHTVDNDPEVLAAYQKFDKKVGTVTKVDGADVLVAFKGEPAPVRFSNANRAQGVGMYAQPAEVGPGGKTRVEVVYFRDPASKTVPEQKQMVEKYLSRTKPNERRSPTYYTGFVTNVNEAKTGGWYFTMYPQQRTGEGELGIRPTTISPFKGKVLYIGIMGRRPPQWEKQWEGIKADAGLTDKSASKKLSFLGQLMALEWIPVRMTAGLPLEKQQFTNPKTKNKVLFTSLPAEVQKAIRDRQKQNTDESEAGRGQPLSKKQLVKEYLRVSEGLQKSLKNNSYAVEGLAEEWYSSSQAAKFKTRMESVNSYNTPIEDRVKGLKTEVEHLIKAVNDPSDSQGVSKSERKSQTTKLKSILDELKDREAKLQKAESAHGDSDKAQADWKKSKKD